MTSRRTVWIAALASLGFTASCSSAEPPSPPPEAAGFDETFLDRTADPCTDFYQFACGNWIIQHPVTSGTYVSRYIQGDQQNDLFFEQILEGDPSSTPGVASAQALFNTCMVFRSGGATSGAGPIQALTDAIDTIVAPSDLGSVVGKLHASGIDVLFEAGPTPNVADPTHRILAVEDGGYGLPDKSYYDPSRGLEAPYESHMSNLAALFPFVTFDAQSVYDFEAALANASADPAALRDPVATYNPTEVSSLATEVPEFDWAAYFSAYGYGTVTQTDVVEPSYFAALHSLLSQTTLDVVKQYLKWRVLEGTASFVNSAAALTEFDFHDGVVFGEKQAPEDWFICLSAARGPFGMSLSREFVDRYFPASAETSAKKLLANVQAALKNELTTVTWLDDPTRAQALDKLGAMLAKVGYPDQWLTDREATIDPSASYLEDRFALVQKAVSDGIFDLTAPVDRSEWTTTPATVNAFYSPISNAITVPAGIIAEPFFSPRWPAVSNYGVLGSVLGHETTHGFDDQGRQFDATGKLSNWWSPSVAMEFSDKASCLVDQYSSYEPLPGMHIDGNLTLGENIADLGGVKLSLAAYRASAKPSPAAGGFTPDQLFFLSFAQIWCENVNDDTAEERLATDPHSPGKYRVNGVVRNVPEFASAFHCQAGSPLAPSDRCDIW